MKIYMSSLLATDVDKRGSTELDDNGRAKLLDLDVGWELHVAMYRELVKLLSYGFGQAALIEIDSTLEMSPQEFLTLQRLGMFHVSKTGMTKIDKEILPPNHSRMPFMGLPPTSAEVLLVAQHDVSEEEAALLVKGLAEFFQY